MSVIRESDRFPSHHHRATVVTAAMTIFKPKRARFFFFLFVSIIVALHSARFFFVSVGNFLSFATGVTRATTGSVDDRTARNHTSTPLQKTRREDPSSQNNNITSSHPAQLDSYLEIDGVEPKAFEPWPIGIALPCFPPDPDMGDSDKRQLSPTKDGFLFIKTIKTGSSSAAGVNIRVARNVARRRQQKRKPSSEDYPICKARFHHQWASRGCQFRHKDKSFLWTILREPSQRLVSQYFFFEVSGKKKNSSSDEEFRKYVEGKSGDMIQDHYLSYLSPDVGFSRSNNLHPLRVASRILNEYNFIAISERMEESVVVLSMLLGIPIADVMFLSAKLPGGYAADKHCHYIQPTHITESMQSTLDSKKWKEKSHWDYVLYRAAIKSLDLTIDRLGRPQFEKKLEVFRRAQVLSQKRCLNTTVFPCSGGKYRAQNDCFWRDSGCGMECLDGVATEMSLW